MINGNRPPRTADGNEFRFRAGRLSLDLCSTLLWRHVVPTEQLQTPADLARWLSQAAVRPAVITVDEADLRGALRLREATYALVNDRLAGRALTATHIRTVNGLARHPDPAPRLTAGGELAFSADRPGQAALSKIARDAIELLTGPSAARVRECAAPDCAFLFVDTSRPGRRRWCSTDRCGNRQHVREHRRRHAAGLPQGASA